MGDIHESVRVACPFVAAATYLSEYLKRHGSDRDSAHFNMRLEPAALQALELAPGDRGVRVAIRALRTADAPDVRYRIRWLPERVGPHTLFLGALALDRLQTDHDAFALRLDGRFELPRDASPHALPDLFAQRIAAATAAALLGRIDAFVTDAADTARTRGQHTNGVAHGYRA